MEKIGNGYHLPTADVLAQVGKDPKITKEFALSHSVCDRGGVHLHFGALVYPARYAITAQQKEQAARQFAQMKAKFAAGLGGLVFIGMGMEYSARYPDDVCNHRIRTEIINPKGRRFFIEVGTGTGETMRIDHVIDRDQEDEYKEKAERYYNLIKKSGTQFKEHPLYPMYLEAQKQPYNWYKHSEWSGRSLKYTNENVIKLVNQLFDCNFSRMVVDNLFLNCGDYVSK